MYDDYDVNKDHHLDTTDYEGFYGLMDTGGKVKRQTPNLL